MWKWIIILLLPFSGYTQNTIGLPDVLNYAKETYNAGLQNWDIQQDSNGVIYIANNEGLMSFDGHYWSLYPLPNRTIVRSVAVGHNHHIYVGGQDELGYFAPSANGQLQYHSLTALIPEKQRSFGDVWDIVVVNQEVFFRSQLYIFRVTNLRTVTFYAAPLEWSYLGVCNGQLYAHDYKNGLLRFEQGNWAPVQQAQLTIFPLNEPITGIIPAGANSAIVTLLKSGLFRLTGNVLTRLQLPDNAAFVRDRIYAATAVNEEWMALATSNGGVYITDFNGRIIQRFSRAEGLQNNNVLSILLDKQKNLWLGLDNGIDLIAYNSAIKHINPNTQDESGYTALIHNNRLYAGTSAGLYSVPLQSLPDLSYSQGLFTPVKQTSGQVWRLDQINNQLLMGHHEGAFLIRDNAAIPIATNTGYWNFVPLSPIFPTTRMLSGAYKGLSFFDWTGQSFSSALVLPDFIESCRFIALDESGNIWVSHPYHGVYKITQAAFGKWIAKLYTDKAGLPSTLNNHVYTLKREVVVATEKGIYVYDAGTDRFIPSPYYQKLLGDQSLRYLKEDGMGNIWFVHEKMLGVVDMSGARPVLVYLPELNNKMLSGFEFIYPVDASNIFVSGGKGFFHINYDKYKKNIQPLKVHLRSVRIVNERDSLLFGGYALPTTDSSTAIPVIAHAWKTIQIEFSSLFFGRQHNLEYQYRLRGFEDNWSVWTTRTAKEYTNLPAGLYTFEVKVRNHLGSESDATFYTFRILPPWYQTRWAFLLYACLAGLVIWGIYKWQKRKFRLQQARHEAEQKKMQYIHELEIGKTESELVTLRNEKLEAEINFKNAELAASAMHLVTKGELLTKMKAELMQVMKRLNNEDAIKELRKMLKAMGEDENIDQEWENFARHFDKVHSRFFVVLKAHHPNLTGNDLKLCAHLRMNLSTKEIAQLHNISVRGVEIGRYRLRKKLGIASDMSLFDYLIGLQE
jgi:DNA-binding CsgD family transcriptional regulator